MEVLSARPLPECVPELHLGRRQPWEIPIPWQLTAEVWLDTFGLILTRAIWASVDARAVEILRMYLRASKCHAVGSHLWGKRSVCSKVFFLRVFFWGLLKEGCSDFSDGTGKSFTVSRMQRQCCGPKLIIVLGRQVKLTTVSRVMFFVEEGGGILCAWPDFTSWLKTMSFS